jgi:hypothetical protein
VFDAFSRFLLKISLFVSPNVPLSSLTLYVNRSPKTCFAPRSKGLSSKAWRPSTFRGSYFEITYEFFSWLGFRSYRCCPRQVHLRVVPSISAVRILCVPPARSSQQRHPAASPRPYSAQTAPNHTQVLGALGNPGLPLPGQQQTTHREGLMNLQRTQQDCAFYACLS